MKKFIIIMISAMVLAVGAYAAHRGRATNVDRIVTGSNNRGTDPNTGKDITLANDEYIDNSTDGQVDISGFLSVVGDTLFIGGVAKIYATSNDSGLVATIAGSTITLTGYE